MASLLDLFVKIGAKDEASGKIGKVASGAKTAFNAIGVAVGAAATAVGTLTKAAVSAYADYEQLVGGVETLFGAGGKSLEEYATSVGQTTEEANAKYDALMQAQQTMLDNASRAYETAGLSANDYMETVTGFSAALISSLGGDTVKAAEYADMALVDMADNANKMGTDMESIQNAYQGFAKQNYTMLDNLKLGYGGTKSEMERLLATANEINAQQGVITDYQIESYADIVEAIHVVQDEMGITGTTSHEAATTIQGSVGTMKAAWTNWLTGLGDSEADMAVLTDKLLDTVITAADNVLPIVQNVLTSVSNLLTTKGPKIMSTAINFIVDNLPSLLDAGITLIESLISGISEMLPEVISTLVDFISDNLPTIMDSGVELLFALIDGIIDSLPQLIQTAIELVLYLAKEITDAGNLSKLINAAIELILALVDGLIGAIPQLLEAAPEIIQNLVQAIIENAPKLIAAAAEIIAKLLLGIVELLDEISGYGEKIVQAIMDGISAAWDGLTSWFTNLWNGLFGGTKTVDVQVNKTTTERTVYASSNASKGSKPSLRAIGLDYVPYNGYPAMLHRGETVLTAQEASEYRKGNKSTGGVTFNGGITVNYTGSGVVEEDVKRIAEMLQFEIEKEAYALG